MKGFPHGGSSASIVQEAVRTGHAYRGWMEAVVPAKVGVDNGVAYFALQLGNVDSALFSRIVSSDRANVRYEVMAGAVASSYGSAVPILNMNQYFQHVPSPHIFRPCTVSNPGIVADIDVVRGGSGSGNRTTGSTFSPEDFRIFKRNQEIIVRAVNPDADIANFLLYYKWFQFDWP